MILLKQAGLYLGWGFQLQSPLIVGLLSLLMFVIGLILLTDINIGSAFTRLGGIGASGSLVGSFSMEKEPTKLPLAPIPPSLVNAEPIFISVRSIKPITNINKLSNPTISGDCN